jgi:phosphatidylglycerol lysyltransferase
MHTIVPGVMSEPTLPIVRDLVMRFGWNATAYQVLNPGIHHWLSPARDAAVGYVRKGGWWLVAGAPICDVRELGRVTCTVERAAAVEGCRVCYVCAARRMCELFAGSPTHTTIAIGAEPVWNPLRWPAIVAARSSLRAQLNRARNKGVRVERWNTGRSTETAALRPILHQWLGRHALPPMHFLVEPDVLAGEMADRLLLVATQGDGDRDRRPVAFLVASPVPARQGYLVEEIARGDDAPNGTAELLIDAAMTETAKEGSTYITLGLVALSTHAGAEMAGNPRWVRLLMSWARAHGRRFYHFEGLENFRAKMSPETWETIYAITNRPSFTPSALHAVGRAFCDGSPELAVARAAARAVRQEARWALRGPEHRRE